MAEKETSQQQVAENQQVKRERFEFIFTVNGNIICQRYFRINGFNRKSLYSEELAYEFDKCVNLIKRDLVKKSNIFLWYTSPQVYENKEEMENVYHGNLEAPTFVVLRDSDETYVWNGTKMELYNGYFNKSDYVGGVATDTPCVLKLAFLDFGKEVISREWDGNVYPRFVRTNIDLSNSKNKYENGNTFAPFESALIKLMIDGQQDLIPIIVKKLCVCCSKEEDEYTTSVQYGDKTYNLNRYEEWAKYVSKIGSKLRKKTDNYFKMVNQSMSYEGFLK